MKSTLKRLLPYFLAEPVPLSTGEKLRSGLAAFGGILLVGLSSSHFVGGLGLPLMVASMGASAVLLFAAFHSPLAQPWPLLGGKHHRTRAMAAGRITRQTLSRIGHFGDP